MTAPLIFREYRSARTWRGLPLLHVAAGGRDVNGRYRVGRARGVVAVGGVAVGFVAVGGVAVGLVSVGGVSLGLFATVGGVAVAAAAVGVVSVGVLAVGVVTVGVIAVGVVAVGVMTSAASSVAASAVLTGASDLRSAVHQTPSIHPKGSIALTTAPRRADDDLSKQP